jgi:Uma2 family endonuclease
VSSANLSISVDQYLSSSFKPLCEYIDGVLRQKPLPTKLHPLIQFRSATALRQQGFEALAEVTVRVSATKFLIPDVIADLRIEDPYPTKPVALSSKFCHPKTG